MGSCMYGVATMVIGEGRNKEELSIITTKKVKLTN
jgi:hypothetical protein